MAKTTALTTKDLQAGFGVGHMTIYNWRAGSATKDALPAHTDEQKRVTFKPAEVKAWAKKHGLEFKMPTEQAEVSKPGPKAKAAPVKKAAAKPAVKKSAKTKAPLKLVKAEALPAAAA